MSSGGISSRLSGSVSSGGDDGSKIRCAFHGEANSPVVHGIACAFADDPRPSKIAATGPGKTLKRRGPIALPERVCSPSPPAVFSRASANLDPITQLIPCGCAENGEHFRSRAHRSENDRRLRIGTAGLILGARAQGVDCEIEVMRTPATQLARNVSLHRKYFVSQKRTVTAKRHTRHQHELWRRERLLFRC